MLSCSERTGALSDEPGRVWGCVRTPFQACRRLETLLWPRSPCAFMADQSPGDSLPASAPVRGPHLCLWGTPQDPRRGSPSRGISGGASGGGSAWGQRGVGCSTCPSGVPVGAGPWPQGSGHCQLPLGDCTRLLVPVRNTLDGRRWPWRLGRDGGSPAA